MDENVLLRIAAMPGIAREQFHHLVEQVEAVNTGTVQVLPIPAGLHASTHGSMVILDYAEDIDPSIVYLETRSEGLYLEEAAQVAGYRTAFEHVCMDALPKADSAAYLRSFIE
ncbi:Scr1 family TA system antitoxin-like transcriptional regulator [Nocardiopsis sp. LSu2-4]|uniref:Scr1 family TA system antitoxin-like transcriptional regulator n=1 Tax=Nocardiopsis suaedae TaxID=3018444 RepID=A0ABT4TW96_9ACTN|nr:Scr1 family TA system antitoxin-like transcriptional regulator [Nocardiopsis suaedae]MDA2808966.1 Scr1 family TA system antitoxin-like transcriptional regulator [Nocardiopsis suaedae]